MARLLKQPVGFKIPVNRTYGRNRQFRYQWLQEYKWLIHSPSKNGGYCAPFVMFATDKDRLGQLLQSPMTNFARAANTVKQHSQQSSHFRSMEIMVQTEVI